MATNSQPTPTPPFDASALLGALVWCIKTSMEEEGYGEMTPQKPWLGKVTDENKGTLWVSRVDENGVPDDDSNATALCRECDCYRTEAEAFEAWRKELVEYIEGLEAKAAELRAMLAPNKEIKA